MELPVELERFVPQWDTLSLGLYRTAPETLTRFASAVGWALRAWQAEEEPLSELERVLTEAMAGLEGLSEEQAGQWLRVTWFLLLLVLHRRDERELDELVQRQAGHSKFREREEVGRMRLTLVQQMEARGEARGAEKMLRDALRTVLTARFGDLPAEVENALVTADVEAMNGWLPRASTAASLEEVGILPSPAT